MTIIKTTLKILKWAGNSLYNLLAYFAGCMFLLEWLPGLLLWVYDKIAGTAITDTYLNFISDSHAVWTYPILLVALDWSSQWKSRKD